MERASNGRARRRELAKERGRLRVEVYPDIIPIEAVDRIFGRSNIALPGAERAEIVPLFGSLQLQTKHLDRVFQCVCEIVERVVAIHGEIKPRRIALRKVFFHL